MMTLLYAAETQRDFHLARKYEVRTRVNGEKFLVDVEKTRKLRETIGTAAGDPCEAIAAEDYFSKLFKLHIEHTHCSARQLHQLVQLRCVRRSVALSRDKRGIWQVCPQIPKHPVSRVREIHRLLPVLRRARASDEGDGETCAGLHP